MQPAATGARFTADALRNPCNQILLQRLPQLMLQDAWLVAGCLFQTVWNLQAGSPPTAGIKDYDIFYFDASDLSAAGERAVQAKAQALWSDLPIEVEVTNQARVHLWYADHFGFPYDALTSSRSGIDRFLVTCTCVGLQPSADGPQLYAPNGLDDLYAGVLRANPLCDHRRLFDAKATSYRNRWPALRIARPG